MVVLSFDDLALLFDMFTFIAWYLRVNPMLYYENEILKVTVVRYVIYS